MKTRFFPLILLLGACATTTIPPSATTPPITLNPITNDTDTIGAVVAQLNIPIQAASAVSPSRREPKIEKHLTDLTLDNMRLRQEIQRLKENIKENTKARPRHIPPAIAPKSNLIKASYSPKLVAQSASPIIAPDAPEVPTLAEIAPVSNTNDVYVSAQKLFRLKNYNRVINMLHSADAGGDGSVSARKQMYLLLLSHQKLNNCQSVINIGQRLAGHFVGTHEAAEAQFMVGQCQWNIQQRDIAKDTWRKLIASQPNSPAAQRAKFSITQD